MRVWTLPADIDTDQLAPGHTMKHGLEVTAQHCLERVPVVTPDGHVVGVVSAMDIVRWLADRL